MQTKPILFSAEMVRAILGRKTQTRRVMRVQHFKLDGGGNPYIDMGYPDQWDGAGLHRDIKCPYGYLGDHLWVRETWATEYLYDGIKPSELTLQDSDIYYRADSNIDTSTDIMVHRWRPSIHMPRWASRITLEITGIRVEQVQDISAVGCYREGAYTAQDITTTYHGLRCWSPEFEATFAKQAFKLLWDSLNAKRGYSWDSNPWVWVVEFKQVKETD